VFEGARIDSFEAEIVGSISTGRVSGTMILARATSDRVVKSGVAAGMSGSPVYVGGRLIGALSSGWSFSREPLFGITPIGEMLEVAARADSPDPKTSAGPGGLDLSPRERGLSCGPFRWEGDEAASRPETPSSGFSRLPLPLSGGLRPELLASLSSEFRSAGFKLTPGGQAAPGTAPVTLEPGSAVAVDVLRGDLQLSAIGTVTWRDGNRVLIFGHPFFQAGDVRLPLSTALITTIVASEENSFKLGVRGVEVGVATQDRRPAVAGTLGPTAPMMPIAVEVSSGSGAPQRYRFESVQDRALAPLLLGAATQNSVLESGGASPSQMVRWTLEIFRRGATPLVMHDALAGDAAIGDLGGAITSPVRFLLNNPFERCVLDSIRVKVQVASGRGGLTLRSARVLQGAVRPGQVARVRCEVESWRGERRNLDLELHVPEEAPDGGYVLWLGGGTELTRYEAQRLPGRYRATSLDDAWRRFGRMRDSEAIYASLFASAPEVTRNGADYPELPLSALAVMVSGQTAGDPVRRGDTAILDSVRVPVQEALRGELLLTLNVDRKAP
jgi:hypothetical protein